MNEIALLNSDWHIHSEKPEMTPASLAEMARRMGLHAVGITDHVFPDEIRLQSRAAIMDSFGRITGLKIYYGAEVDVYAPGKVADIPIEYLPVDYILLSFTHIRPGYSTYSYKENPRLLASELYQLFMMASAQKGVFGLAHPFSIEATADMNQNVMNNLKDDDLAAGIENSNRNGIAFELNATRISRNFSSQLRFLKLCRELNAHFFIGSDTHFPKDFKSLKIIEEVSEQLELKASDFVVPNILNTEG